MTARATIRQGDIRRAIRAAKAEGLVVQLLPDGRLQFVTESGETAPGKVDGAGIDWKRWGDDEA